MSHRPTQAKKVRKLRKLMRATPATKIDLVQYLRDRGYAQTAGEAREIILAGRVKSESHTVGIREVPKRDKYGFPVFDPETKELAMEKATALVDSRLRSTLVVTGA